MKEAIQKAIEGGYKMTRTGNNVSELEPTVRDMGRHWRSLVLDPLFWKSLGKAMGWRFQDAKPPFWQFQWHSFIDHLAGGKDAESFFEELLK